MATIKDLKFDDKNFNKHTEYGMSLLEKSLRENGAGRSILLDKDNNIIAGNGVVEAAGQIGLENVKIVEATGDEIIAVKRTDISLSSKKGREMALADNATAKADLEWDEENLKSEFDDEELKGWGVDLDWQEETEVTEDEAPEVNESDPADSQLGKVYQLGNHRLMCGDSTDAGSVAILMDGQKADMVFTDPPYGLDYSGGRRQPISTQKRGPIKNDDLTGEQLGGLLRNVFKFVKDSGDVYICASPKIQKPFLDFIYKEGKKPEATIVWDKQVMGLGFVKYRRQCEFIIFIQGKPFKMGDRQDNDLWSIKRDPGAKYVHSTQKPIKVPTRAIENSSNTGESVLDLFGGSGSTLIACEQLGRKCYMMELDPKYCDVIRKRYWKFKTGSEEGWQDGTKTIL